MRIRYIVFLFYLLILFATGCSWMNKAEERSSDLLIKEGIAEYNKGNYHEAILCFENLKNWYPFSKYIKTAELKIADSHYYLSEYQEAIIEYTGFMDLHPKNEAIPYVIFQTGLCYFEQICTIDRDMTSTEKALTTFNTLLHKYPEDKYSKIAKSYMHKINSDLAEHEFYIAMFYYKSKHYKAALKRFKAVIIKFPDTGKFHQKALDYIALCDEHVNKECE